MSSTKTSNIDKTRRYWRRFEFLLDQAGIDQWTHPADLIDAAEAERQPAGEAEDNREFVDLVLSLLPTVTTMGELPRYMVRWAILIEQLLPGRGYTTPVQTARDYRLHLSVVGEERAFVDSLLHRQKRPGPFCLPRPVEVPRDASASLCAVGSNICYPVSKPSAHSAALLRLPAGHWARAESSAAITNGRPETSSPKGQNVEKMAPQNTPTTAHEKKRAA
jgi:hypothetical protein